MAILSPAGEGAGAAELGGVTRGPRLSCNRYGRRVASAGRLRNFSAQRDVVHAPREETASNLRRIVHGDARFAIDGGGMSLFHAAFERDDAAKSIRAAGVFAAKVLFALALLLTATIALVRSEALVAEMGYLSNADLLMIVQ